MILSNEPSAAVDASASSSETEAETDVEADASAPGDGESTRPAPAVFAFPNRILFGEGSLRSLPGELAGLGIARPLLVTDAGLAASGLAARVGALLDDAILFDGVQPNPTEADVLKGLDRYRSTGRDGLVGLGGGSAIDAAKAIRLLAARPGELADYDSVGFGEMRLRSAGSLPPMIAAPTTAGTGAEVGRTALIRLAPTGRKAVVSHPGLLPEVAVCDPESTATLTPPLTAGTGMTALVRCMESFLAASFHPICDGLAVEGLRTIFRGLETAVHDGADAEARSAMMMGALLGGVSGHKGMGVVQTLADALGGDEGRIHHGAVAAVLLAHGLRFNREAAEPRMVELASRLGLGRAGDGAGHLVTLVELLMARMPLPRKLGQIEGLSRDRIPKYARLAMLDPRLTANPRPCSAALLEDLLDRAW